MNFSDELLAAYPDAKVVLTTRDVDKWLPSMERSYYKILAWKWWMALAAVDNVFLPSIPIFRIGLVTRPPFPLI